VATTLKPADDGNAYILRLFGASGHDRNVKLSFPHATEVKLSLTNTTEHPVTPTTDDIVVPAFELVTVRAQTQ
jgi:alpha-mannosidase